MASSIAQSKRVIRKSPPLHVLRHNNPWRWNDEANLPSLLPTKKEKHENVCIHPVLGLRDTTSLVTRSFGKNRPCAIRHSEAVTN